MKRFLKQHGADIALYTIWGAVCAIVFSQLFGG